MPLLFLKECSYTFFKLHLNGKIGIDVTSGLVLSCVLLNPSYKVRFLNIYEYEILYEGIFIFIFVYILAK